MTTHNFTQERDRLRADLRVRVGSEPGAPLTRR